MMCQFAPGSVARARVSLVVRFCNFPPPLARANPASVGAAAAEAVARFARFARFTILVLALVRYQEDGEREKLLLPLVLRSARLQ